ncbi:winged helix-turn-helix domain-containing protein [Vibrio sp. D404a]|uniref:winged helix-turn-helix domain-containing protein n=1 Tax=unclassified Vibrio TaxID=2614977 RepID=UPI0025539086|nr:MULTISPECIES: winged helix-turn-helix domain-containing protein [unclassified Vibrio]MDK9738615.1 winged helix-turn-helix domain-containing protein [Vibrio sp. D404a]MDK9795573.1 winged helix-turn-helix domain-containing protein [Vibrio sp. D449a]
MQDFLSAAQAKNTTISIADLVYNPATRELSTPEEVINLEPRSIELLELLLRHVGEPISAELIIEEIWKSSFISKNVLTNRISTLRSILQKHLPESDATKILVTYPRKGYFLNPSSVQLFEPEQHPVEQTAKVHSKSSVPTWLWFVTLALLVTSTTLGYLFWQSSNQTSEAAREQRLIPKVELLLSRVDAVGDNARKYRTAVKALLLQQQIEYSYTDLANQDAPSYFVDPIDNSPFFPGAKNMRTSDYLLNIQLKDHEIDKRLSAQVSLIYPSSGKLAYRGVYSIQIDDLSNSLMAINRGLASYFSLPEPEAPLWTIQNEQLNLLLSEQVVDLDSLKLNCMNSTLLARKLALFETDHQRLAHFTNRVQTHFKLVPDELKLWLGVIHFKLRDLPTAKELLTNTSGHSRIENALIYMMISHISFQQGNLDNFRLNYMESLVALLRVIPSEALFDRLSQPESKETCLQPWSSLKLSIKEPRIIKQWENLMVNYCTAVGKEFSN